MLEKIEMLPIDVSSFNVRWLFRKKRFDSSNIESSQLERCLGLLELTALGIGATLGAGIYVVTPDSTRQYVKMFNFFYQFN